MRKNSFVEAWYQPKGECRTFPVYQYDYGLTLLLKGFDGLKDDVEVHFSNQRQGGKAAIVLGTISKGVAIPDEYLTTGHDIWAWIYVHNSADNGETVYVIQIPVIPRSKTKPEEPTPVEQSLIEQTLARLETAADKAEHYGEMTEEFIEALLRGEITLDDGNADDFIIGEIGDRGDNGMEGGGRNG